jgi:hypothetical protein
VHVHASMASTAIPAASSNSRRQLVAAIERMEQVGTEVAGTVLNAIDSKNDGYYYSYYYADAPAADGNGSGNGAGNGRPSRRGAVIRRGAKDEPAAPASDRERSRTDEVVDVPEGTEETLFGDR